MTICGPHRLTNHGLEAPPPDSAFGTADEAAAGKVLQRLRSEEAADGSTAARAAGASPLKQGEDTLCCPCIPRALL